MLSLVQKNTGKTCTSHPEHELKLKNYKKPYICNGCKGHGIGERYRCEECDYELHKDCMVTTTPNSHDFFGESTFKFYKQHPGKSNGPKIYCDACGKRVKGFVYHCPKTNKDLHPCCHKLKKKLEIDGVKFCLRETVSKCSWCKQNKDSLSKIKGWSYVSECGKHNIHVDCFMEVLVEGWKDGTANDNDCSALKILDLRSIQVTLNRNSGKGTKYLRIGKIFLKRITGILLGDSSILIDLVDLLD